jgi:hypothetical protein
MAITVKDRILSSAGANSLQAFTSGDEVVEVLGYRNPYDGGGGLFRWVVTANLPAGYYNDGGFIFDSTAATGSHVAGTGKWIRVAFYEELPCINVKWFGAAGDNATDDTVAIQNAFDFYNQRPAYNAAAKVFKTVEIFFPTGKYRVAAQLNYITYQNSEGIRLRGEGNLQSVIIPAVGYTDTCLLNLDGSELWDSDPNPANHGYQFQKGGYIKDLGFEGLGSVTCDGLRLSGWWNFVIDNCRIQYFQGDGIVLPLRTDIDSNPDYYTVIGEYKDCFIIGNLRWGWNGDSGQGGAGNKFFNNIILNNRGGGIRSGGTNVLIQNGSIAYNGDGGDGEYAAESCGVRLYEGQNVRIWGVEFDTNAHYEVRVDNLKDSTISYNRMLYNFIEELPGYSPSHTFILLGPLEEVGFVIDNVDIDKNWFRIDDGLEREGGTYVGVQFNYPTAIINIAGHNDFQNAEGLPLTPYDYARQFGHVNNYHLRAFVNGVDSLVSPGKPNCFFVGDYDAGSTPVTLGTSGVNYITIPFDASTPFSGLEAYPGVYASGVFTCPIEGFYTVSYSVAVDNLATNQTADIAVLFGGLTKVQRYSGRGTGNIATHMNCTLTQYCYEGDQILVRGATTSGTNTVGNYGASLVTIKMLM